MAEQVLLCEDDDGVRTLTLNRPEKLNALNLALTTALHEALVDAEKDSTVRSVVLSGGGRAFCAGADINEFSELTPDNQSAVLHRAHLTTQTQAQLRKLSKPVVSAVQGAALGGGAGLAIGCDMMVVASDLQFGYPEVRRSIVPAIVMAGMRHQVGQKLAFEMVSTGRLLDASEALNEGLANRVTDSAEVLSTAQQIAKGWATASPEAMAAIKSLFYRVGELPFDEAMQAGRDTNAIMRGFEGR